MLNHPARNHEVEGYASLASAASGERVQLRVNVDHPKNVHWELYRMGYYQGLGGRFISSSRSRMIEVQPACVVQSSTGLVECNWADAFDVGIDKTWASGQYFFKLIADDESDSFVPLIVREAQPRAKVQPVWRVESVSQRPAPRTRVQRCRCRRREFRPAVSLQYAGGALRTRFR
jgi:hypothetical protein